jgi:2-polyprenyl-6-methoxyphenol hydroxylase-like FAD-dependent oxidoreductase
MPPMPHGASVLIVGAGPVGLVLANELARREVRFRIVDKLGAPTDESRAILVQARSLEMMERLGVVEAERESGIETHAAVYHSRGRVIARVGFDGVDSPYPYSISTEQPATERVLTEPLAALGTTVERGVELVTFTQDDVAVRATLRHDDGSEETATVDWIVGADGGHSAVRDAAGTALKGSFKGQRFLLGDVDADYELERDATHAFFAEAGPVLLFPMHGNRVRLIAEVFDDGPATVERLQTLVDERVGGITVTTPHWLTTIEIHHAQVPQYRIGRAFLAGDAAHVHSPAAGQGMNTGMQDAFNLGWKLAFAANGTSCEKLLDSYHAERHPVAAKVIEATTTLTRVGTLPHALERAVRDHAMHAVTALAPIQHVLASASEETDVAYRHSPIVAAGHGHGRPRPGDAAPDVPRLDTPLHAALAEGTGHVLLVVSPADGEVTPVDVPTDLPAAAGLRQVAAGSVPDDAGFDAVVGDPDRLVAARYGLGEAGGVIVVRPDGYIGARAPAGDGAAVAAYLAALTG